MLHNQFHPGAMLRNIEEARRLADEQRALIADLAAAGLNTEDVEATLKALAAQIELLRELASNRSLP